MTLEENKALIHRFVEEVQCQHNLAALDDFFSPDLVDYSGMTNPPNREGTRALFAALLVAFPDHHFTIHQQLAEGDKVMTHKTFRGTHLGPFIGIPPTGKQVSFDLVDIFTVVDGKITEHWIVSDQLRMMQQLGGVPGP